MFTAKVLYCYLVCKAEDDDDFVVEMTKPLPADVTKDYIRNNIIGKTNEELANVKCYSHFHCYAIFVITITWK